MLPRISAIRDISLSIECASRFFFSGVEAIICDKLELKNKTKLSRKEHQLEIELKLSSFDKIREKIAFVCGIYVISGIFQFLLDIYFNR